MRCLVSGVAAAVATVLASCTSSSPGPTPATRVQTIVSTVTSTRAPSIPTASLAPFTSAPTVHPLAPGDDPRGGEVARSCPYLKAGLDAEPTEAANVADIEGDRVGRVTVLTRLTPVGCRFYFFAPPYGPTAAIVPRTYPTASQATAALRSIIVHGTDPEPRPGFVTGVDGVRFRTPFNGPDHGQDWAFAFAKGRVLVVVYTRQTNVSINAEQLAKAVVGRF